MTVPYKLPLAAKIQLQTGQVRYIPIPNIVLKWILETEPSQAPRINCYRRAMSPEQQFNIGRLIAEQCCDTKTKLSMEECALLAEHKLTVHGNGTTCGYGLRNGKDRS